MKFTILERINLKGRFLSATKKTTTSRSGSFSSRSESTSSDASSSSLHKTKSQDRSSTPTTVLPPCSSSKVSTRGTIATHDLANLLKRLGPDPPSDEELLTILCEADPDGDGCIDLDEFGSVVSGPVCGPDLRAAFDLIDKDGDGRIVAKELLDVFAAIGDESCTIEDCRRMIAMVNCTGDGFVSFDDFARMMEQQ